MNLKKKMLAYSFAGLHRHDLVVAQDPPPQAALVLGVLALAVHHVQGAQVPADHPAVEAAEAEVEDVGRENSRGQSTIFLPNSKCDSTKKYI